MRIRSEGHVGVEQGWEVAAALFGKDVFGDRKPSRRRLGGLRLQARPLISLGDRGSIGSIEIR